MVEDAHFLRLFWQLGQKLSIAPQLEDYRLFREVWQNQAIRPSTLLELKHLCRRLWVKSVADREQFEVCFDNYFQDLFIEAYKQIPSQEEPRTEISEQPSLNRPTPQNQATGLSEKEDERTSPQTPSSTNPSTSFRSQRQQQNESQVAQAVSRQRPESQRFPLGKYTLNDEYFRPLTRTQLSHGWDGLRSPEQVGWSDECDIPATIEKWSKQGFVDQPELLPHWQNQTELLLLVDCSNSMLPFDLLSQRLIKTAHRSHQRKELKGLSIRYFRNYVDQKLFQDADFWKPIQLDDFLAEQVPQTTLALIFSDAGAARGGFNETRWKATIRFLQQLRSNIKHLNWLNPLPEEEWQTNTAGLISREVSMYPLSLSGWRALIKDLKGQSGQTNYENRSRFNSSQPKPVSLATQDQLRKALQELVSTSTDSEQYGRAAKRILAFVERMPHAQDLLYHLAFPLTLTPDLAYFIRENFLPYQESEWLIVPKLLLSGSLCQSVGHQLYEIDGHVRHLLLRLLKEDSRFGATRLEQLSDGLLFYIQQRLEGTRLRAEDFGERPEWIALAYTNPTALAEEIALELEQAYSTNSKEQVRLASLSLTLAEPLREAGYQPLLTLGRIYGRLARGDDDDVASLLQELLPQGAFLKVGNVRLPIPGRESEFELMWLEVEAGVLVPDDAPPLPEFKTMEYEVAKVVLEREADDPDPEEPQPFTFITATLRQTRTGQWKAQERQEQGRRLIESLGGDVTLEMVEISAGSFTMGSPESEAQRSGSEGPQHEVTLASFLMGRYPVTQAQWQAVAAMPQIKQKLNQNPSNFTGDELPVEQVSWEDAMEFCARLSEHTNQEYSLPSEAQWEYACRAGTTTPFHFGETLTTDVANYDGQYTYGSGPEGEYRSKTTPVGSFPANAWGLHDMHGNVREWCLDPWHDNYTNAPTDGSAWTKGGNQRLYAQLGGSWHISPGNCRSAFRYDASPALRNFFIGFRVMCVLPRTLL